MFNNNRSRQLAGEQEGRGVLEGDEHRRALVEDVFDALRDEAGLAPDVVKFTRVGDSEGIAKGFWTLTKEERFFSVPLGSEWQAHGESSRAEPTDSEGTA